MAKQDGLVCELCEKACRQRLPHPTTMVDRGVHGGHAKTPQLICLKCTDKVRRELGGAPVKKRAKPDPTLQVTMGPEWEKAV
jgi:hypothetical protein